MKSSADSSMKACCAQVVFDDVEDLDAMAKHDVAAAFWESGENWSYGSGLVAEKSTKAELMECTSNRPKR